MTNDVFTFLVGGKAGEGVKKAGGVAAKLFANRGLHIFQYDDYMSVIRGAHNFSIVSASPRWIGSQYLNADLVVNFDKRSYDMHKTHINEGAIVVYNSDEKGDMEGIGVPLTSMAKKYLNPGLMYGVGAIAILAASIGLSKEELNNLIRSEYSSGIENNIEYANAIYDQVVKSIGNQFKLERGTTRKTVVFGNQAIGLGAIAGSLDVYYAYPMTPSSSLLHYLASVAKDFNLAVIHPESEVAVINMAVGSAFTGAKTMVGTSGGGFALMVEGVSLAGMVEAPVLCALVTRPGPATGVPTYTAQGELFFAINAGHGEFLRIVASPGTVEEAFYLTAEMLDLVWKFQTPGILLTDKQLAEGSMTVEIDPSKVAWAAPIMHKEGSYKRYLFTETGVSPMLFSPSKEVIKWNSHEHDEYGITTEVPELISRMHEKRVKKIDAFEKHMKNLKTINVIRGENSYNIITYGSVTMSVLEALRYGHLKPTVVQVIYLNPLPVWELEQFKNQQNIVIEQCLTEQFATLLKEKAGISIKSVIKKYDGRPFDPIELSQRIGEVIKGG